MSQLTANNANGYIGKLVTATADVKGYTHLNTTVTPPFTTYKNGVEIGVLQKVEQVKSDYWGLIKLKYPVRISGKVLGVTTTKTYSDLYIPIKFLAGADGSVVGANVALTRDVWCSGTNVYLRKSPQTTAEYITTYTKGNYIGKTDAVARTAGSYSGGNTWYTIQLPDGRIGYMATPYCTLTKPATTKTTTPTMPKTPAQQEFMIKDSNDKLLDIAKYVGIGIVAAYILYRFLKNR